jgi:hypothetical protein
MIEFSAIFLIKESDLVIRMTSLFFRRGSEEEHVNSFYGLDNTLPLRSPPPKLFFLFPPCPITTEEV